MAVRNEWDWNYKWMMKLLARCFLLLKLSCKSVIFKGMSQLFPHLCSFYPFKNLILNDLATILQWDVRTFWSLKWWWIRCLLQKYFWSDFHFLINVHSALCSHTGTPPMQVVGINMFKTKKQERSAVEPRVFFTTQAKMPVPIEIIFLYLKKAGKFSEKKNLGKIIKKSILFLIATHVYKLKYESKVQVYDKKKSSFIFTSRVKTNF